MEYDLVICVYACDTNFKYKEQIYKMNEVYNDVLKEYLNIKLLYFLGEEKTDLIGEQYINLTGVKNDYLSASYKQFLGLKYIYENFKTKFVICIGTDTYINIKKLNLYLKEFDFNDNLYIGGHGDYRVIGKKNVYFHSGGPGFIITFKCLELIYSYLETFMNKWIKICNENNINNLVSACDVGIAYLVTMDEINTKIIYCKELSFINCNFKGYPCHINQINLKDIISCHNMSLQDFDEFTNILKNNNYYLN
jgi:hypothetical protein